jgi:hypothetical protein
MPRAQVLKLRHLFRARDLGSVRIGSVDDYQVRKWKERRKRRGKISG